MASDHEPRELPLVRTPVTADELGIALFKAWSELWRERPARETVLVLLAHSAFETGRWRSMWCNNIGNVKSRQGDGRDWTYLRCHEYVNGEKVWFNPPHPATRFRAFRSLDEGAVDHLAFLRGMKRYAAAWPRAIAGDPRGFVHELKRAGYFTSDVRPYADNVASLFHTFDKQLPLVELDPVETELVLTDDERARIMGRVALSLRDLGDAELDEHRNRDTDPPPPGEGNS